MSEDHINYPALIDAAMRSVVREVIALAADEGLPGEHHFFISFRTDYPGVKMSGALREKYPREMTIVLQHQFWDLQVYDEYFTITLSFHNTPEKLAVPFAALTAFADPSIKFGLQFHGVDAEEEEDGQEEINYENMLQASNTETGNKGPAPSAEIITLDTFRNNKK